MRHLWPLGLLLVFAACTASPLAATTPDAAQILAKPLRSSFRDATVSLVESFPPSTTAHTAHGTGVLTTHPLAISWAEIADPPLDGGKFEFISLGDTDYTRLTLSPGPGPWHADPSTWGLSNPATWPTLSSPHLIDSPKLNNIPAWHVSAQSLSPASSVELWVRQSDGYPLRLTTLDPDGTRFDYTFSNFNTGKSVQAPY